MWSAVQLGRVLTSVIDRRHGFMAIGYGWRNWRRLYSHRCKGLHHNKKHVIWTAFVKRFCCLWEKLLIFLLSTSNSSWNHTVSAFLGTHFCPEMPKIKIAPNCNGVPGALSIFRLMQSIQRSVKWHEKIITSFCLYGYVCCWPAMRK